MESLPVQVGTGLVNSAKSLGKLQIQCWESRKGVNLKMHDLLKALVVCQKTEL